MQKYITGFTGSSGTAVVTMDQACLWTDGRYFVQASHELEGSSVTMMKMGHEGVPEVEEYLDQKLPAGGCLGFDGRVVNAAAGLNLEDLLEDRNIRISYGEDLIGKYGRTVLPCLHSRPGCWRRSMRANAAGIKSQMCVKP